MEFKHLRQCSLQMNDIGRPVKYEIWGINRKREILDTKTKGKNTLIALILTTDLMFIILVSLDGI